MCHAATSLPTPTGASPSRRALLGAAAWSVPAITLSTAAPAFAMTDGAPAPAKQLAAQNATATITKQSNGVRTITGSVLINNATATATTALQAIFSMSTAYMPTGIPTLSLSSLLGTWTYAVHDITGDILTVTLNAPKQLEADTSTTINFSVTAQMSNLPVPLPAVSVHAAANGSRSPAWASFIPGAV